MPKAMLGHTALQQVTFAVEIDPNQKYSAYIWYEAKKGETCMGIASRRGHPEEAQDIARLNNVRSVRFKFNKRRRLRLPGTLKQSDVLHVVADDPAPNITDGYAKLQVVDRPGNVGLNQFTGYDPVAMDIPVQFMAHVDGGSSDRVEADIALLERLAGRGDFHGAGIGPPAVIRVSTTDDQGRVLPLIPANYQWSSKNTHAPLWRIQNIQWDSSSTGVRRDSGGQRTLQKAVVSVWQYTPIDLITRSAAARSRSRNSKRKVKH